MMNWIKITLTQCEYRLLPTWVVGKNKQFLMLNKIVQASWFRLGQSVTGDQYLDYKDINNEKTGSKYTQKSSMSIT